MRDPATKRSGARRRLARMSDVVNVVFETHSTTEDNESGIGTGWNPGRLSVAGREQARMLGGRRRDDGIAAIFTSDLERALETVNIAFDGTEIPIFHDWRLRECNYGALNGTKAGRDESASHIDTPYPSGESWHEAIDRVSSFLPDLYRWRGQRVLVVGHVATGRALDLYATGASVEEVMSEPFTWRPGWEYVIRVDAPS
jgi:2,3-bisphosphoglycerate-dependent phosphoglycerate mutase